MKSCPSCQATFPQHFSVCPQDGAPLRLVSELPEGSVVRGKYRILSTLGRGGMGVVYKARHEHFDEVCALKLVTAALAEDPVFRQRFHREALVMRKIRHPHALSVTDVDTTDDGAPFIVMEYVEGPSVADLLRDGHPLPPQRAVRIAMQVCEALGQAHSLGIIHRDIKPSNILLTSAPDGGDFAKVLDFGLAKLTEGSLGRDDASLTHSGMIMGTPSYMSPEQCLGLGGDKLDGRTDLYSLGIVLFEMFTGRIPFSADTPMKLLMAHIQQAAPDPRTIRAELPAGLAQVVLRALEKDAANRYATAAEMRDALAAALRAMASGPAAAPASLDSQDAEGERLEMAHVLFMDIVGYSKLPMDAQTRTLRALQEIVQATPAYRAALKKNELIRLPTGDGMALGFFGGPEAPVRCALEVARAVKEREAIELRMGVHSGPVYKVRDIKDSVNIAGAGINYAQRVMDCGDSGHILLSDSVAGMLSQHSQWARSIHELGWAEVKHGVKIHLFNLVTDTAGNREVPRKLRAQSVAAAEPSPEKAAPPPELKPTKPAVRRRVEVEEATRPLQPLRLAWGKYAAVAGAAVTLLMVIGVVWMLTPPAVPRPTPPGPVDPEKWTFKQVRVLDGDTFWARSLVFSPDGKWLAAGGGDRKIRIWDVQSGELIRTMTNPDSSVVSLAVSPDGRWLASGSYRSTARLWDVQTGEAVHTFTGHTGPVNAVTFHPDSRTVVTGGYNQAARFWDVSSGKLVKTLKMTDDYNVEVWSLAYSPDGRWLASGGVDRGGGSGGRVTLWDAQDNLVRTFPDRDQNISVVVFSPDSRRLFACCFPNEQSSFMAVYDVNTGQVHRTAGASAVSPDGQLSISTGEPVTIRDSYSGKPLRSLDGSVGHFAVAMSPDGRWLVAGNLDTKKITMWRREEIGPVP